MNTLAFNKALTNSKPIVCFKCFKENNRNSENGVDALIASIDNVDQYDNCMRISFETGRMLDLDFNGGYKKYKKNGMLANECSVDTDIRLENGHIQLKIEGTTILLERLIAICDDIVNNKMPLSYEGWVANVMDGSGSVLTACELGIPVNYHPNNIEWCTSKSNGFHSFMIRELYKRTGHVYRFSANDMLLREIFLNNDNYNLRNYCHNNLLMIK